jgi:hypothetical protein
MRYLLIKTKAGSRRGTVVSYFLGENESDPKLLKEVETHLRAWLDGYNNSLTAEAIDELFKNFDGSFQYDVWSFKSCEAQDI